ncbi:APC family permease [Anatilimnocola floriformis]|uniref:APC family permease n=1 Tax=Anatilimnocola floriformis TaxID=2948575 RepID=UPI0020C3E47D|nr:amino acid permease [Anatilimnocola floriformis]
MEAQKDAPFHGVKGDSKGRLSLLDTTSIIVGIIIGSTIFKMSPTISSSAANLACWLLQDNSYWVQIAGISAIWIVGGLIALMGAVCYAELATALPQDGGSYVYLKEAFGRRTAFAFAWTEFWIVRPGNIGAIAFVAAIFALQLLPAEVKGLLGSRPETALSLIFICVLTAINLLGIQMERWTQNLLTAAKVLGLVIVALLAWLWLTAGAGTNDVAPPSETSLSFAMIMVMFAYGGWSDMSYVAAEVDQPRRNISRALLLGTGSVLAIYLLLNLGFARALGLAGLYGSQNVASDVLQRSLGAVGDKFISLLVAVSCLGAIHGMIFTGARVYYKLGSEHPLFGWLGAWHPRLQVPLRSILAQSAVTVVLVAIFGANAAAFDRLVMFTGPFYWGFICLVIVALVALRWQRRLSAERYRVPLYPLPPLLFSAACIWMAYSGIMYAWTSGGREGYWALVVVIVGLLIVVRDSLVLRR